MNKQNDVKHQDSHPPQGGAHGVGDGQTPKFPCLSKGALLQYASDKLHVDECLVCGEQVRHLEDSLKEPSHDEDDLVLDFEFASMCAQEIERRHPSPSVGTDADSPPPKKATLRGILAVALCVPLCIGLGWMSHSLYGLSSNTRALLARIDQRESLAVARTTESDARMAVLQNEVNQLYDDFLRFVRLSVDDSTLARAESLRMRGARDEWETVLTQAQWSPDSFDFEAEAMREWAQLIAFRSGIEYFLARRYTIAERLFERARRLGMHTPTLLMAQANIHKESNDWERAAYWLDQLVHGEFPRIKRAQAANLLAYCLYNQAEAAELGTRSRVLAEAEQAVDLAIELAGQGGYAKAYVQKALILQSAGKPAKARDALAEGTRVAKRKLADHPDSPRLHFTLAILHARLGEIDRAAAQLGEAIAREDRDFPVSWWTPTESAFAELPASDRERILRVIDDKKGQFTGRDAPLAITVSGLLWDEDFRGEPQETPATRGPTT